MARLNHGDTLSHVSLFIPPSNLRSGHEQCPFLPSFHMGAQVTLAPATLYKQQFSHIPSGYLKSPLYAVHK